MNDRKHFAALWTVLALLTTPALAKPLLSSFPIPPAEEIQAAGQVELKKEDVPPPRDADRELILDLSGQADGVWTELVRCNAGNPEEARQNLGSGKICGDPSAAQTHTKTLAGLEAKLLQFLTSSEIRDSQFDPGWFIQMIPGPKLDLHPLFVHLLAHAIASQRIFAHVDDRIPMVVRRFSQFATNGDTAIGPYFSRLDEKIRTRLDTGSFRIMVQGLKTLLLVQPKNCTSWGLWPQATRAVVQAVRISNRDESAWRESQGLNELRMDPALRHVRTPDEKLNHFIEPIAANHYLERTAETLEKRITSTCGNPESAQPVKYREALNLHRYYRAKSRAWWIDLVLTLRATKPAL